MDTIPLDVAADWIGGAETADLLNRRAALLRTGIGEEVRREAGLFAKELMLVFPPYGRFGAVGESFASQRRIGRAALERDLAKIFVTPSALAKRIAEAGGGSEEAQAAARGFLRALSRADDGEARGILRRYGVDQPAAIGEDYAAHHASRRGARGRVGGGTQQAKYLARRTASYNAYRRALRDRVSRLKAGWAPAAAYFGAVGIPPYIAGHPVRSGAHIDTTRRRDDPAAILINAVPYSDPHFGLVRVAERNRGKKLEAQINALREKAWRGRL